ncbi:hypothetical protein KY290_000855 [Solanum tuberosum]|uniref:60S ribosomal protein L27 n=1 Tax=Solanum tuberosum TaxID=4113 RepID=A0ABQ7WKG6_SOLTU|nr:hypothetical protein KY289_000913 [Solanum tuberosum]KAH0781257.1 hypothetical protein KY290_000855 [Solanum tuberosum]
MVKFLKPNKVVIILQGKYVARKVVIKNVIGKDSAKKQAKKSCVKAFIKLVNYNHIMPTHYTLDMDLKDVVNADVLRARDKKVVDLLVPYQRGEKIGLFVSAGVGDSAYYGCLLVLVNVLERQMNEPHGARARVGLTELTVVEHFRDTEGKDVLHFHG